MIFGKWRKHEHEWVTTRRVTYQSGRRRWARYGSYTVDECVHCGAEQNEEPITWDAWKQQRFERFGSFAG